MFEDNLIHIRHAYGTTLFLNKKNGKFISYNTLGKGILNNSKVDLEGNKLMLKLLKLYKKIPTDFNKLPKLTPDQMRRIEDNEYINTGRLKYSQEYRDILEKYVRDNISPRGSLGDKHRQHLIYMHVETVLPRHYNRNTLPGFSQEKMLQLIDIINMSQSKGNYILKKFYISEKSQISKHGLDYVLKTN